MICTVSFAPFSVNHGATYDIIHHACTLMLMILIGPLVIKDIVMRPQEPHIAIHAKFLLVHSAANCINLMRDTDIYFEMRTQHQKLRLLRQQLWGSSRQLPTLRAGAFAYESFEEFESLVQALKTGAYGPPVPVGLIESCDGVLRRGLDLGMHDKIRFNIQDAAPCDAGDVSYLVLRAAT